MARRRQALQLPSLAELAGATRPQWRDREAITAAIRAANGVKRRVLAAETALAEALDLVRAAAAKRPHPATGWQDELSPQSLGLPGHLAGLAAALEHALVDLGGLHEPVRAWVIEANLADIAPADERQALRELLTRSPPA